jgi:hypothetical protein
MIPKIIHYLFGLDSKFCNKPFEYFHYLNILSAYKINPEYTINLYYYHRPDNVYFDQLSKICNLVKLDNLDCFINKNEIAFTEHLSDVLRINILKEYGGIYLDIDTVCIKSFNDLLEKKFVMGIENAKIGENDENILVGLCNAVLISEKDSEFINIWINDYINNYKPDWNHNSVKRPLLLSYEFPHLIHVEPQESFFKYSWDEYGHKSIFEMNSDISDCYSLHLWEHKNYNTLIKYNKDYICNHNDTLSTLYKNLIDYEI